MVAVAVPTSSQRRPKPAPCPDQGYVVSGGVFGAPDATLTVQGRMVSIDGVCPPIRGRVKATRKGTRVIAGWKACGEERRVRLRGRIDVECALFTGTIAARRRGRVSIVAAPPPPASGTTVAPTSTTAPPVSSSTSTTTPAPGTPTTTVMTTSTSTTMPARVACDEQSLRQAVAVGGAIVLDCDAVTIPIAAALVVPAGVAASIASRGPGTVVLNGSGETRLFVVAGTLELADLVVEDFAAEGELGDDGVAAADGTDGLNGADGGPGENGTKGENGLAAGTPETAGGGETARGGAILIASGGVVRLTRVVFRLNLVFGGYGGDGAFCNGPPDGFGCGDGGIGGDGGAGGALAAGVPGSGGNGGVGGLGGAGASGSSGGRGGNGEGGAIYNAGTLEIADSTFDRNEAIGGFGGIAEFGRDGGAGGFGGDGGDADEAGGDGGAGGHGGDAGAGGQGGPAGHALGGAIHNAAGGALAITRTVFMENVATGGDGGDGGDSGFCDNGGDGGVPGVARDDPAGNGTGGAGGNGGAGGDGGAAGNGGDALGGAIYNAGTLMIDASVVFVGNDVVGGLSVPETPDCLGGGPCPGLADVGCDGGLAGDGASDGDPGADGTEGAPGTPPTTGGPDVGP